MEKSVKNSIEKIAKNIFKAFDGCENDRQKIEVFQTIGKECKRNSKKYVALRMFVEFKRIEEPENQLYKSLDWGITSMPYGLRFNSDHLMECYSLYSSYKEEIKKEFA